MARKRNVGIVKRLKNAIARKAVRDMPFKSPLNSLSSYSKAGVAWFEKRHFVSEPEHRLAPPSHVVPYKTIIYSPLDVQKICKDRKVRREVLFAKNKQGGNHKPPVKTINSFVRCN